LKVRTTFFVLNTFLLLCSVLTGLKVIPGPDIFGTALAFYALFILPGILLSRLLKLERGFSFFSILRYFLVGLVLSSFFSLLTSFPIFTFRVISIIYAAVTVLLLLIYSMKSVEAEDFPAAGEIDSDGKRERLILFSISILLFAALFVFFNSSGEMGWYSDSLDHISFVRRSLETNTPFPMDSFHRVKDGAVFDPRKGLWHAVLALWTYQADVEPHFLWAALPSFLSFIALSSFILFAMELTGSMFN